jgi:predicted  nucleic acid-binding Zn-ribbon protein
VSVLEEVLAVQELDTATDQLRHLLDRLPERAARVAADREVKALEAERASLVTRTQELDAEVAQAERDSATIDTNVERLNRQMKTVISPREAEALQHELAALAARRSDLDDVGLLALDTLGEIEVAEATLDDREPALREAAATAASLQAAAEADIARRVAELAEQRAVAAAALPPELLDTYEHMRVQFKGTAISRLHGSACGGCHLDLSRSEIEAVRAHPDDEPAHCPNCDRWLIR